MSLTIQTRTVYTVGNQEFATRAEAEAVMLPTMSELIAALYEQLRNNTSVGTSAKIVLIMAVRDATQKRLGDCMGLGEAKDYVESAIGWTA